MKFEKKERAGASCINYVYLFNATSKPEIGHTSELKKIIWLSANEVINKLTFPDLKKVFQEVLKINL